MRLPLLGFPVADKITCCLSERTYRRPPLDCSIESLRICTHPLIHSKIPSLLVNHLSSLISYLHILVSSYSPFYHILAVHHCRLQVVYRAKTLSSSWGNTLTVLDSPLTESICFTPTKSSRKWPVTPQLSRRTKTTTMSGCTHSSVL
jgi:hypothetical protein